MTNMVRHSIDLEPRRMIHEARFSLPLARSDVATFIVDVTRAQEYFPGAIEGGTFADGEAIWI